MKLLSVPKICLNFYSSEIFVVSKDILMPGPPETCRCKHYLHLAKKSIFL